MEGLLEIAKSNHLISRLKNGNVEVLLATCNGDLCGVEWKPISSEADLESLGLKMV